MKTKITNVRNVLMQAAVVLFLSLTFSPSTVQAQDKVAIPIEVKFIGNVGNQPIFLIEFSNQLEEVYHVTLKDNDGNIIYTEKFKDKKFSKKFQLNEIEIGQITVILTSKKDKQAQVFQIDKNVRVVEDVVVTKLR